MPITPPRSPPGAGVAADDPVYRRPSDYTPISTGLSLQYWTSARPSGQLLGEPARDRAEQRREGARPDGAGAARAAHARRGERQVSSIGPVTSANDGTVSADAVAARARRPSPSPRAIPAGIGPEITLKAWLQRDEHRAALLPSSADPDFMRRTARSAWAGASRSSASTIAGRRGRLSHARCRSCRWASRSRPSPASPTRRRPPRPRLHRDGGAARRAPARPRASSPTRSPSTCSTQAGFSPSGPHRVSRGAVGSSPARTPPHPVMMLWSEALAVVPVTVHIPLAQSPGLTTELIVKTARIVGARPARALRHRAAAARRRRAQPARRRERRDRARGRGGHRARGRGARARRASTRAARCPADTMFHAARADRLRRALAMYHDQALIPIKTIAFDEARERHARPALRPHLARPRHRLRHRRQGRRPPRQPDRGAAARRAPRGAAGRSAA